MEQALPLRLVSALDERVRQQCPPRIECRHVVADCPQPGDDLVQAALLVAVGGDLRAVRQLPRSPTLAPASSQRLPPTADPPRSRQSASRSLIRCMIAVLSALRDPMRSASSTLDVSRASASAIRPSRIIVLTRSLGATAQRVDSATGKASSSVGVAERRVGVRSLSDDRQTRPQRGDQRRRVPGASSHRHRLVDAAACVRIGRAVEAGAHRATPRPVPPAASRLARQAVSPPRAGGQPPSPR